MSCNNILVVKVPVACAALGIVLDYYNILPISHMVTIMCWKRAVSILVTLCAWQLSRWHQIILLVLWIPMELLLKHWFKTCEKSFSCSSIVRQHMEVRLNVAQFFPMETDWLKDYPKPEVSELQVFELWCMCMASQLPSEGEGWHISWVKVQSLEIPIVLRISPVNIFRKQKWCMWCILWGSICLSKSFCLSEVICDKWQEVCTSGFKYISE